MCWQFYGGRVDPSSVTPSPHQLKALTHPARLRMLGLLRVEGPATATSLATLLGLTSGTTSYHLRQLAQHGFVEDAAELGNGRERWWRAVHSVTRTEQPPTDDVDAGHGLDAYLQSVVSSYAEQAQWSMQERPLLSPDWREASMFSSWNPRLTPQRARELVATLDRLLSATEDHDAGMVGEDTSTFTVQIMAFPRPGGRAPGPP